MSIFLPVRATTLYLCGLEAVGRLVLGVKQEASDGAFDEVSLCGRGPLDLDSSNLTNRVIPGSTLTAWTWQSVDLFIGTRGREVLRALCLFMAAGARAWELTENLLA